MTEGIFDLMRKIKARNFTDRENMSSFEQDVADIDDYLGTTS